MNAVLAACFMSMIMICHAFSEVYDVVLKGGRVMDPETQLDAVMNVGIKGDKITAVTNKNIKGNVTVDVNGLVVTPGFIDTHQHSLELGDARLHAQDGVTTHLELEFGRYPVKKAYEIIEKRGHPINYGFATSWMMARAQLFSGKTFDPTWDGLIEAGATDWGSKVATKEQLTKLMDMIQKDMNDGAVGVGYPIAYGSGSGTIEGVELWKLTAKNNLPVSVHVRYQSMLDPDSSVSAMVEMLGLSAATGAHAILCHIQLLGLSDPYEMLDVIAGGIKSGLDLTTEVYPFGRSAPPVSADYLKMDDADKRLGFKWNKLQTMDRPPYVFKGRDDFRKYQKENPTAFVQMDYIDESTPEGVAAMKAVVTFPNTIPAADGAPFGWKGKPKNPEALGLGSSVDLWPLPKEATGDPRTASTHAVILGRWVRGLNALTLADAVRNSTLVPAQAMEKHVSAFKTKGRLQVGMDADITVFDPSTVKGNADWDNVVRLNDGFYHTLVNGQFVLRDGKIIKKALPGKAIKKV